jgi:hypothetical protein
VNQVSCASPGNCAATGNYTGAQDHNQAFVADEKNGTWGGAIEVPGSGALNGFGHAFLADQSTAPTMSAGQPGTASGGGQAR